MLAAIWAVPAHAALPAGNLIQNPGAEAGQGSSTGNDFLPIPGWQTTPNFTAVQYGTSGFPDTTESARIGGGANFFAGGQDTATSTATQTIDVSSAAADIDSGGVSATLSGDLGGFAGQSDSGPVTATFLDSSGHTLQGSATLAPVTPADRGGQTIFIARTAAVAVPRGTRSIVVTMTANRVDGSYNDTYFDNLSLTLAPGPPPPVEGVSADAFVDSGTVLVKPPPGAAAKGVLGAAANGFVPLSKLGGSVPMGSTVDTTRGKVRLVTATGAAGKTQTGHFSQGLFIVRQAHANPLTTVSMTGGNLSSCGTKLPAGGSAKAVAARRRSRSLFSNVSGHFRTLGRNSSATVRGTQYLVKDTCAGTLTTVKRGVVTVRDFSLRKTVTVRAHHRYLARPPRKH